MREPNQILTARDLMTTNLLVFSPEETLLEAVEKLIKWSVSGAPVVDEDRRMVGMLSELDCLRGRNALRARLSANARLG